MKNNIIEKFNSLKSISIDETLTRINSALEYSKKFNSSLKKKIKF